MGVSYIYSHQRKQKTSFAMVAPAFRLATATAVTGASTAHKITPHGLCRRPRLPAATPAPLMPPLSLSVLCLGPARAHAPSCAEMSLVRLCIAGELLVPSIFSSPRSSFSSLVRVAWLEGENFNVGQISESPLSGNCGIGVGGGGLRIVVLGGRAYVSCQKYSASSYSSERD